MTRNLIRHNHYGIFSAGDGTATGHNRFIDVDVPHGGVDTY